MKCCIARTAQALASRGALSSFILEAGKHRFEIHGFDIRYRKKRCKVYHSGARHLSLSSSSGGVSGFAGVSKFPQSVRCCISFGFPQEQNLFLHESASPPQGL